jgi:Cu(I)/Ag(I) efflux system membrane fusion protein
MALVPIAPGGDGPHDTPSVPGRAPVLLSAERRQLLGVRSESVRRVPLDRTIRTVGRVALDGVRGRVILADVYEHDLAGVRVGMRADVTLPHLPGEVFKGSVTHVAPVVDEATRSVRVRVEVDRRGDAPKPGSDADVFLRVELGSGLAVNQSAVIDTGERRLVFLDRGEGRYEPREVTLGPRAGPLRQVLEGLEEGDRVVTSANFLLDSESSLRAAVPAAAQR